MSTHFVARQGQELYFFYHHDKQLKYRVWKDSRLLPEATLHAGAKMPFTVFHHEGLLHTFCQDTEGDILLFTHRQNTWHRRTLMQGDTGVLLTPIVSENGLCILYNGFSEDTHCLFKRSMTRSGDWHPTETIDHFSPFSFAPYEAQVTGPGHLILFYQTQAEECQVGYREITPKRTGTFHRFLNMQGSLADASFLTTQDAIHILMIVKTTFSCQLLYRKKTEDVFTPPTLLWESPKVDQCLLTMCTGQKPGHTEGKVSSKGKRTEAAAELHATCMVGGRLHRAVSGNDGDSFSPMAPYKRKFCADPVKASYVTPLPQMSQTSSADWFARQVYVDSTAPWDVQMLPDLCPDFYPKEAVGESTQLRHLHERLAVAQRAMEAKDRQILELMYQSKRDE